MYDSAFVRLQPGYGVTQSIFLLPFILFIAWLQMRLFREEKIIWNDYLWPLIVVNNQDKFTLQLALANLVGTNTVEWGTLLAYAILVLIPVLIVFLFFQRQFLKGQTGAAIKG